MAPAPRPSLIDRTAARLRRRSAEIKLALRVAFAGILSFALARELGLAQGVWAVITAVIVVQTSIGGSVKAAVERSIGTLAGAFFGGAVGWLLPLTSALGMAVAVAIALTPLAFLAAVDPRFRVAPVTALIILLTASPQVTGALHAGLDRILEIALGNLVGVAVSIFFLPARAHFMLADNAAEVVEIQADLLGLLLGEADPDAGDLQRLRARTRATLKKLEAAAEEAKRERQIHLTNEPDPDPLVRTLYRLRHDLVMIGRACAMPLPDALAARLRSQVVDLGTSLQAFMRAQGAAMRTGASAPPFAPVLDRLGAYAASIEAIRAEGLTRGVDGEAIGRFFALRFALDQLGQDLAELSGRAEDESAAR